MLNEFFKKYINNEKILYKFLFFSLGIFFIIFISIYFDQINKKVKDVEALLEDGDLKGFAWMADYGWISFNSINCDSDDDGTYEGESVSCPNSQAVAKYKTRISPFTKEFSGYAWSSNLGWISFGNNTSENFTPPNTTFRTICTNCKTNSCLACYNPTDKKIYGWAKILNLGDQGWIRLNDGNTGDGVSYGLSVDANNKINGYVWHSLGDSTGGWIHSKNMSINFPPKCIEITNMTTCGNRIDCETCGGTCVDKGDCPVCSSILGTSVCTNRTDCEWCSNDTCANKNTCPIVIPCSDLTSNTVCSSFGSRPDCKYCAIDARCTSLTGVCSEGPTLPETPIPESSCNTYLYSSCILNSACSWCSVGTWGCLQSSDPKLTDGTCTVSEPVPNNSPTVNDLSAIETNMCNNNPSVKFAWRFSDSEDGTIQTSYSFKLYNGSGSIIFTDEKNSLNQYVNVNFESSAFFYNDSYTWSIIACDSKGACSSVKSGIYVAPKNRYPSVDFIINPKEIAMVASSTFEQKVTFYDGQSTHPATSFDWLIDGVVYNDKDKIEIFISDNKTNIVVKLTATDINNYSCEKTKTERIQYQLPEWREGR